MKPGAAILAFAIAAASSGSAEEALDCAAAVREALAASSSLRESREALRSRSARRLLGLRAFLPVLSLSFGEDESLDRYGPDSFAKTLSVGAEQPVWDGGRLLAARGLEAAELAYAAWEADRLSRDLREKAVDAYRAVLSARAVSALRAGSAERQRLLETVVAGEAERGQATEEELASARLEAESASVEEAAAELARRNAEADLARLLGRRVLPPLREEAARPVRAPALSVRALAAAARAGEPALRAKLLETERRKAALSAASASPSLSLTGSLKLGGERFPLTRSAWTLGVKLSFNGPWAGVSSSLDGGKENGGTRNASSSVSLNPIPDPASAYAAKEAALALGAARRAWADEARNLEDAARRLVEARAVAARRLDLAESGAAAARRRARLAALAVDLGRERRSDLMELETEAAGKAVAAVEARDALFAAERSLEAFADIEPGGLARFAAGAEEESR